MIKNLDEPNYPALRRALLAGYCSQRPINPEGPGLFLAIRAAGYVGWIGARMHEPGAQARAGHLLETACAVCTDYLAATREPDP